MEVSWKHSHWWTKVNCKSCRIRAEIKKIGEVYVQFQVNWLAIVLACDSTGRNDIFTPALLHLKCFAYFSFPSY